MASCSVALHPRPSMHSPPPLCAWRVSDGRRSLSRDVVTGEPHVGDVVYLSSTIASGQSTPVVLPTSTSGVLPITLPDATPDGKTR